MNNLKEYIIEKLHLNKNIVIEDNKYILFFRTGRTDEGHVVLNSLRAIVNYMNTNSGKLGNHYVFVSPEDLVDEFIKRWDDFNPINLSDESPREWVNKNGIKELHADDINNFRANEKNR
jgi:hypothetical protein